MSTAESIKRAAERAVSGEVNHLQTSPVVETFRGAVVWEGTVETFGHAGGIVYAWAVQGATEPQYVTVQGGGKIDSPVAAVRAWIVSQAKNI